LLPSLGEEQIVDKGVDLQNNEEKGLFWNVPNPGMLTLS
jgi:hypothetical protein